MINLLLCSFPSSLYKMIFYETKIFTLDQKNICLW
uniref:Uncharacterized protein n=1 Tax=Arundo donax TaxID=35708 RepID=A0A0A9BBD2_ARUDO